MSCHVNLLYSNLEISDNYFKRLTKATKADKTLQILKDYLYEGWPSSKEKISPILNIYWNFQKDSYSFYN